MILSQFNKLTNIVKEISNECPNGQCLAESMFKLHHMVDFFFRIGGFVQQMVWNKTSERLAVLCRG